MSAYADELVGFPVSSPMVLPQMVPSSTCLRCDVCCRFPGSDSSLRPYFTEDEIAQAVAGGAETTAFPNLEGSQVRLVPDLQGDGYLCPLFDSATAHCRIYRDRPLDCQLYPLAIMWNKAHDQVLLGWDATCPFMRDQIPQAIQDHTARVLVLLEQPSAIAALAEHPRLIGRFQDNVTVLASLPQIAATVSDRWGSAALHRFTVDDVPRMMAALLRSDLHPQTLAAYSPAYHYIWSDLLAYWWMELQGAFCLFAQSADGWFMPLPPLGTPSIDRALAEAFALMRRWNGDSPVGRVENVSPQFAAAFRQQGYQLTPKEPDYVYLVQELAALAGDRYKSHRALCNRVEREQTVVIEPYSQADRQSCRRLFGEWASQKQAEGVEPFGTMLLADAESSHAIIWDQASALQVIGRVARTDGTVRAYTFGYRLTPKSFCVLAEVADRRIPGLAQYLFRDTCRWALTEGADYINTMDDAGLAGLRASKAAYHPAMLAPNFVARASRG